ncbi:MAG: helix-turn-helix domain-containing protein [Paludibacteraceae bacterium]|nr:helix-turn-helix domain-containing protein [Paludibacteraceae bacterium]
MIKTQIILPSDELRSVVHHYWIINSNMKMSNLILPMGCMKWMFHRKNPFIVNGTVDKNNHVFVCGQYDKAIVTETDCDLEMICVFFQPYASKLVMDLPCDELFDTNVDFDCLENNDLKILKRQVLEAENLEECIKYIENAILKMVIRNQDNPYVKPLVSVFKQLSSNIETHISDLASTACLGERQFRRVFSENVGLSPKQSLKIHRFLTAARTIQNSEIHSFEDIVALLGYTDNSHFNKEFHSFLGMSPTKYMSYVEDLRKRNLMNPYKSYHENDL